MLFLLFLVLILPFLRGDFVEFGLKLKEFCGLKDEIIFGQVSLFTEAASTEFKEVIKRCLEDYMTSDVRPSGHLEGVINTIRQSGKAELEKNYELTGDIEYLQNYLRTMVYSYYEGKNIKITFTDLPILRQRRTRQAKIGEIVNLEYIHVFTGFDDPILDYLVSFRDKSRSRDSRGSKDSRDSRGIKDSKDSSDSSDCSDSLYTLSLSLSDIKRPLFQKQKSEEKRKIGCDYCAIS